jgi:hypothetical protein
VGWVVAVSEGSVSSLVVVVSLVLVAWSLVLALALALARAACSAAVVIWMPLPFSKRTWRIGVLGGRDGGFWGCSVDVEVLPILGLRGKESGGKARRREKGECSLAVITERRTKVFDLFPGE